MIPDEPTPEDIARDRKVQALADVLCHLQGDAHLAAMGVPFMADDAWRQISEIAEVNAPSLTTKQAVVARLLERRDRERRCAPYLVNRGKVRIG